MLVVCALGCGGQTAQDASAGTGGSASDTGCDRATIACADTGEACTCEGVFELCAYDEIWCEADAEGEPHNCSCGEPRVAPEDCEYALQHRCDTTTVTSYWQRQCTCDPVLPTDAEPCRFHQEMMDAAGEDLVCSMLTLDDVDDEWGKYACSCHL